ncbi:hypothetical protein [Pedosphaera parvula]|nr:hypothetical protein [Pedosphaera parvula]
MTTRTAELAFFIVQFVTAPGAPAPVLAANITGRDGTSFSGSLLLWFGCVVWFSRHGFLLSPVAENWQGQSTCN